jgi:hypothetical protein
MHSSSESMKRLGGMTEEIVTRFLAVYADARKPRIVN